MEMTKRNITGLMVAQIMVVGTVNYFLIMFRDAILEFTGDTLSPPAQAQAYTPPPDGAGCSIELRKIVAKGMRDTVVLPGKIEQGRCVYEVVRIKGMPV